MRDPSWLMLLSNWTLAVLKLCLDKRMTQARAPASGFHDKIVAVSTADPRKHRSILRNDHWRQPWS